jgi:hypothetical protein
MLRRRLTAHGQWDTWSGGAEDGSSSAANGTSASGNGHATSNGSGQANGVPVASMGWKHPKNGQDSVMELRWPNTQRYLQRMDDVRAADKPVCNFYLPRPRPRPPPLPPHHQQHHRHHHPHRSWALDAQPAARSGEPRFGSPSRA